MTRVRTLFVLFAALVLTVGVATATAGGGGNSPNAKLCQKGGWTNLVRSDQTTFANETACVSYAAKGGSLLPKPTCTSSSENWSGAADWSHPTTFAGGTIDTAYGTGGSIRVVGSSWSPGNWSNGTHLLLTNAPSFKLSFTNAVASVSLDVEANLVAASVRTLTGYDASDAVVDTDSFSGTGANALAISSATNNIKYFVIGADNPYGVAFTNIVWGCAS